VTWVSPAVSPDRGARRRGGVSPPQVRGGARDGRSSVQRLLHSHIPEERAVSRRTRGTCVPSPHSPSRDGRPAGRPMAGEGQDGGSRHAAEISVACARSLETKCDQRGAMPLARAPIAFCLRLRSSSANPVGMARPPILSFPHKGGRNASDGGPRPSLTNGCVNRVGCSAGPPRQSCWWTTRSSP
jgi:hypothetical protein